MSTALATFDPFVALFPCPPWCDPNLCKRRHEVEDDGRLTEVAAHAGPVTVVKDPGAEHHSLHVAIRQCDINDDTDPPEITIGLNGATPGDRECCGVVSLTPVKARELAALLAALADTAVGVAA